MADYICREGTKLELDDHTKRVIRDIFKSKDTEGDGVLNSKELEACLHIAGFNPTPEDLEFLAEHFDKNGDGQLQIDELIENLDIVNVHSIHGKDLKNAFQTIDKNGDGYISKYELTSILRLKGPNQMTAEEADEFVNKLLKEFDLNRDGKFSYQEFVTMFMDDAISLPPS